jgi:hypothetical protein
MAMGLNAVQYPKKNTPTNAIVQTIARFMISLLLVNMEG